MTDSPLFLAGVGLGGAATLTGVLSGSLALSTASTLRTTPFLGEPGTQQISLQHRASSLAVATDVLIPFGLATIGASVLFIALRRPKDVVTAVLAKPERAVEPQAPVVSPSGKADVGADFPTVPASPKDTPTTPSNGNSSPGTTPVEPTAWIRGSNAVLVPWTGKS